VAVSNTDDPSVVKNLPRLPQRPGPETLLARSPDLVLLRPMNVRVDPDLPERLARFGVAVAVLDPPTPTTLPSYLERLGRLLGREEEASRATREGLDLLKPVKIAKRVSCFLVVDPRTLTTCAPGSWADRMIAAAGGIGAAPDARPLAGSALATFGAERLVARGNRVSVLLVQRGAMSDTPASAVKKDPRLASLAAVRTGRVFDIPEEALRPSLLRIREGLSLLRKTLGTGTEARTP
jgi:iron complex transport system substrate-binding protein